KPLSKIMAGAPSYKSTGEIVIPCPDEKKFFVEKKVGEALKENYYVEDLAGDIRVKFRDGLKDSWGLVRNSDTTPAMQVYAWAKNDRDLERVRDIMVKEVQRHL
ncbi:phosphomannomutase, partial [Candidatus Parcubacteria bacterium]|nr:phosphomannomutase [Candidatus Parcubacteria bacterium]